MNGKPGAPKGNKNSSKRPPEGVLMRMAESLAARYTTYAQLAEDLDVVEYTVRRWIPIAEVQRIREAAAWAKHSAVRDLQ